MIIESAFAPLYKHSLRQLNYANFLFPQQDDQGGVRTLDDDNFIDDTGVDPADCYDNDNDGYCPRHYAQVLILNCSYAIGNCVTSSYLDKLS
jgi:hypothetical protein